MAPCSKCNKDQEWSPEDIRCPQCGYYVQKACHHFFKRGECKFGDKCNYLHVSSLLAEKSEPDKLESSVTIEDLGVWQSDDKSYPTCQKPHKSFMVIHPNGHEVWGKFWDEKNWKVVWVAVRVQVSGHQFAKPPTPPCATNNLFPPPSWLVINTYKQQK